MATKEESLLIVEEMKMTVYLARQWIEFMQDYPDDYAEEHVMYCVKACDKTEEMMEHLEKIVNLSGLQH